MVSSFSSSAGTVTVKSLVKYCISIFPDSCTRAIPEYVFCFPESPNTAMAVTLKNRKYTVINTSYDKYKTHPLCVCVCVVLPVRRNPLCEHRLCVALQQVPYMEVRSCIEHTEDRRPGVGPLQWDHRFPRCAAPPLRHRLLVADCVQPDAAVPTTHLGKGHSK